MRTTLLKSNPRAFIAQQFKKESFCKQDSDDEKYAAERDVQSLKQEAGTQVIYDLLKSIYSKLEFPSNDLSDIPNMLAPLLPNFIDDAVVPQKVESSWPSSGAPVATTFYNIWHELKPMLLAQFAKSSWTSKSYGIDARQSAHRWMLWLNFNLVRDVFAKAFPAIADIPVGRTTLARLGKSASIVPMSFVRSPSTIVTLVNDDTLDLSCVVLPNKLLLVQSMFGKTMS